MIVSISNKLHVAYCYFRGAILVSTIGNDTDAITERILSFSKQEGDLIASKDILSQEYETEFHRLSSMTRSQDEIKRLDDQLDDNEVRLWGLERVSNEFDPSE
jgi:flagellar capping protein FliD